MEFYQDIILHLYNLHRSEIMEEVGVGFLPELEILEDIAQELECAIQKRGILSQNRYSCELRQLNEGLVLVAEVFSRELGNGSKAYVRALELLFRWVLSHST